MGATLSSRAQWTSVSTAGNKLDFTKSNEELLRDILSFVESFPTQHPSEAGVVFKRPFVWETSLSPDKLLNLDADVYDKRFIEVKCVLTLYHHCVNCLVTIKLPQKLLLKMVIHCSA